MEAGGWGAPMLWAPGGRPVGGQAARAALSEKGGWRHLRVLFLTLHQCVPSAKENPTEQSVRVSRSGSPPLGGVSAFSMSVTAEKNTVAEICFSSHYPVLDPKCLY